MLGYSPDVLRTCYCTHNTQNMGLNALFFIEARNNTIFTHWHSVIGVRFSNLVPKCSAPRRKFFTLVFVCPLKWTNRKESARVQEIVNIVLAPRGKVLRGFRCSGTW